MREFEKETKRIAIAYKEGVKTGIGITPHNQELNGSLKRIVHKNS